MFGLNSHRAVIWLHRILQVNQFTLCEDLNPILSFFFSQRVSVSGRSHETYVWYLVYMQLILNGFVKTLATLRVIVYFAPASLSDQDVTMKSVYGGMFNVLNRSRAPLHRR